MSRTFSFRRTLLKKFSYYLEPLKYRAYKQSFEFTYSRRNKAIPGDVLLVGLWGYIGDDPEVHDVSGVLSNYHCTNSQQDDFVNQFVASYG